MIDQGIPKKTEKVSFFKKSVSALAITATNQRISSLARKTYNVLLAISQNDLERGNDSEIHSAPLSEISNLLEYDSHDYELLKKHLKSLVGTVVEWNSPTYGEGADWEACGLLAHAKIHKVRGEIWIDWSFAVNIRNELLNPAVFGRIEGAVNAQLRSHPALALYEIVSRYQNTGRTPKQLWRWWHDPLTGRVPDAERLENLEYSFFKRDVLKPAIAEVSACTPFNIVLNERKRGRFVSEIQFLIEKKDSHKKVKGTAPEKVDMASIAVARSLGVSDEQSEKLVATYGGEAFASAIPQLAERVKKAFPEPVRDPYRYLVSLMPGHAQQAAHVAQANEAKKHPASLESQAIQAKRQSAWRGAWVAQRIESVEAGFIAMSTDAQDEIVVQILHAMTTSDIHPQILKRFKKDGWFHPLVKSKFLTLYAEAVHGPNWDQPSDQDLLTVASHLGDAGVS